MKKQKQKKRKKISYQIIMIKLIELTVTDNIKSNIENRTEKKRRRRRNKQKKVTNYHTELMCICKQSLKFIVQLNLSIPIPKYLPNNRLHYKKK